MALALPTRVGLYYPQISHQVIHYTRRVWYGAAVPWLLLYMPVRAFYSILPWQIRTRLANRSLLCVLDATGYRTTAVYNPKSDTTAVFRNVGTGICSVLGRSMGQWGETHTRCGAE